MSFDDLEKSVESSRPVELYTFVHQSQVFRYTTDSADITILGATYFHQPGLSRSVIEDTGSVNKSSLTITAPDDFAVAALFEVYPPSAVVQLILERTQRADPTDKKKFWLGRVLNVSWKTGASILTCESMFTRLKQPGLRRIYSKNCPHLLYGNECKADPEAFKSIVNVDAILDGGFKIQSSTFASKPDGYFKGGKVRWFDDDGINFFRGVVEHVGDVITMTHPMQTLTVGQALEAFAGCDRTKPTCVDKFSNLVHYGGYPYIPAQNPFGQNSVY